MKSLQTSTAIGLIIAAMTVAPVLSDTYIVNPDGTGDFPTIQAAIDAAVDGDVIELSNGTFTGEGNRGIDYLEKSITVRSQSGDPETCVIDCEEADLGFIIYAQEGDNCILEGVTITNGIGLWVPGGRGEPGGFYGGAVSCGGPGARTFNSCVFSNNHADGGGGMASGGSNPTLNDCTFSENSAVESGGGLLGAATLNGCTFIQNHSSGNGGGLQGGSASIPLNDCAFIENSAAGYGGGMFFGGGSFPIITSCSFISNNSDRGGGFACYGNSSPTLVDCEFEDNHASLNGGGLYCSAGATPTLDECTFIENTSNEGAGIYCNNSSPILNSCRMSGNLASLSGGAMFCIEDSDPVLTLCTFDGNSATNYGGAMTIAETSSPTISGCSFVANSAGSYGGSLLLIISSVSISNTIIAFGAAGKAIDCIEYPSQAVLECSNVFGNADGDWEDCIWDQNEINGNISLDPLFCGAQNGDFTLQADSPCMPTSPPNEECDLIGAWPLGCDGPTAAQESSWGQIKASY